LSGVMALTFFTRPAAQKKTRTIKMLSQDGKLVEVEVTKLPFKRKRIRDDDIHAWIQRKRSL
jgi:hypothetical protein